MITIYLVVERFSMTLLEATVAVVVVFVVVDVSVVFVVVIVSF